MGFRYFPLSLLFSFLQLLLIVNGRNLSESSSTPINQDLYHSSDALEEQIRDLVSRHPNKLRIETIKTQNQGYLAEISVVTYSHYNNEIDNKSKFRILLMITCLPEFWTAWKGTYHYRTRFTPIVHLK